MPTRTIEYTAALVGVQKAATTTIHGVLREHPGFSRTKPKEAHFFDDHRIDWDDPDYTPYVKVSRRRRERVAMDSSPSYIFVPRALPRLYDYRPETKLVAVFRDPIDRAFSAWSMEYARRRNWGSFDEAVARSVLTEPPSEDKYVRNRTGRWDVIARGLYHQQLVRGLGVFPREQWFLTTFEQVVRNTAETVNEVAEFLGLGRFEPQTTERARWPSPRELDAGAVTPATIETLASAYVDDLPAFGALTGFDVGGWTTSRVLTGELTPADVADRLNAKAGLVARP